VVPSFHHPNNDFHNQFESKFKINKQAEALKQRIHADSEKYDEQFRIGIEIEICLVDSQARVVNAQPLIEKLKETGYQVDYEYGSCQFEFRTLPTNMENIFKLNILFEQFIDYIDKTVQKVYKDRKMVYPVFLGANPSPQILREELITNKPRYKKLAKWQSKIPDVEIDGLKIRALQIATAIQGFHLHLQGQNPVHTALMFNHILNIIPSAILLGANSRLFAGKIFSFHEPRIYLYDQSEEQNSGFPSISKYLDGVEDYIDYITSRKPVIAKDYFELEKERHDDVRIRLNSNFYRIETRVMSVQPTPKSLLSMIEYFIGYLYRAINEERQLRPLSVLREERIAVVRSGYNAQSHFNIIDTIRSQIDFAKKGLADLGLKEEFLNILEKRVENKNSPGDYVAKLWHEKFNGSLEQTVSEIIAHIWEKTKTNQPII
jgi:gamma-glutamyl:cysteine ligase YbdK (ATP-grasp superfamily)